jgi:predicted O-linked N-acetylglucosamine transferase (SPINDLY family)
MGKNNADEERLDQAQRHLAAGKYAEAEALARQVLADDPRCALAMCILGTLAFVGKQPEIALGLLKEAAAVKPDDPEIYVGMGNIFLASGRNDEAAGAFGRAVKLRPDHRVALRNLAFALRMSGKFEESIAAQEKFIKITPESGDAFIALAETMHQAGRQEECIEVFEKAIALKPGHAQSYNNLAAVLNEVGQYERAVAAARQALKCDPNLVEPELNLCSGLRGLGRLAEAEAACRRALALSPDSADAHNNMAVVLNESGRHEQALASAKRAMKLRPDRVEPQINMANALRGCGRLDEAEAACRSAIHRKPDLPDAHMSLGLILVDSGKTDEAISAFRKAIELKPTYANPYSNLGLIYRKRGRPDEAIEQFELAIIQEPNMPEAYGNMGSCLIDRGDFERGIAAFRKALELRPGVARAYSSMIYNLHLYSGYGSADLRREHEEWNRRYAEPLAGSIHPHDNPRDPDRRLRVGYYSPDFRDHVVGSNILPLLREHDHERYEIFCYSNVLKGDTFTAKMKGFADVWRDIVAIGDAEAAELIRNDGIDVLVDLSLHTAGNRLLIFARKPAPVQVTFAGYPSSTGLKAIDYRLTDPYLDPPGSSDEFYSERSFRLPHSFWCFEAQASDPSVNELPALEAGHVTFGCLNTFRKISPATWGRWARVLHAVPGSELMVMAPEGSARETATRILEKDGIDPYRFRFVSAKPRSQYMSLYHRIDIGLDTLPYNGHTTSLDSYWMGVPVVTLVGKTVVGRAGLSQATNLGLTELVAYSEEEFVTIAAKLAGDLKHLAALRRGLREQMLSSPLCDAKGFTRGIEQAYRQMWQTWCAKGDWAD